MQPTAEFWFLAGLGLMFLGIGVGKALIIRAGGRRD